MKILIYNRHFHPSVGGTESSGRIMAKELAALGHEIIIYTSTPRPNTVRELDEGYKIVRSRSLPRLIKIALMQDVVFSRGGLSLRALLASVITRTPLVSFYEMAEQLPVNNSSVKATMLARLKQYCQRMVSLHVCVSDALQSALTLPEGARAFRLYNPISNELWTEKPANFESRQIDVTFIGRVQYSKGVLILGKALKQISSKRHVRVAIVGDGPAVPELRQMLDDPSIDSEFFGMLSGNDLRKVYANSRIVVVPSIAREGMGMVAAEALGSGTPVCASSNPALQEVVGDAGRFHSVGDTMGLAQDLITMLDDEAEWDVASSRARYRRKRFSMGAYRHSLAQEFCAELSTFRR